MPLRVESSRAPRRTSTRLSAARATAHRAAGAGTNRDPAAHGVVGSPARRCGPVLLPTRGGRDRATGICRPHHRGGPRSARAWMNGEIEHVGREVRQAIAAKLGRSRDRASEDFIELANPWGSMPSDAIPAAAVSARSSRRSAPRPALWPGAAPGCWPSPSSISSRRRLTDARLKPVGDAWRVGGDQHFVGGNLPRAQNDPGRGG